MTDVRQASVRANGLEFAYLEAGEGPLVMLLHGFPDDAWTWEHQLSAIAAGGYRAVAPFMRGYHPTSIPEDGKYDTMTLGADLVALLEQLAGDEPAHVVGHDLGALMLYGGTALAPERFATATLIGVNHPSTFALIYMTPQLAHRSFHLWFLAHARPEPTIAVGYDELAFVDYLWELWSPEGTDYTAHLERLKRETLAAPGTLEAAVAYYPPLLGTPEAPGTPEELLDPVQVPTLVIYGEEDLIPITLADEEADMFDAEYRRVDVPGAKHFVHREQPETVNKLLLEWLATADSRSEQLTTS